MKVLLVQSGFFKYCFQFNWAQQKRVGVLCLFCLSLLNFLFLAKRDNQVGIPLGLHFGIDPAYKYTMVQVCTVLSKIWRDVRSYSNRAALKMGFLAKSWLSCLLLLSFFDDLSSLASLFYKICINYCICVCWIQCIRNFYCIPFSYFLHFCFSNLCLSNSFKLSLFLRIFSILQLYLLMFVPTLKCFWNEVLSNSFSVALGGSAEITI